MAIQTQDKVWTEEELLVLPKDAGKWELINGEPTVTPPAGFNHGQINNVLAARLTLHVLRHRLGCVVDGQTGFWMKAGNLYSPDTSFVSKQRLSGLKRGPKGFFKGSPDLAVEVLSPEDTKAAVRKKIREYFKNDTALAWVIDPQQKLVYVYHRTGAAVVLRPGDFLMGEQVVPGFKIAVAELFEEFDF